MTGLLDFGVVTLRSEHSVELEVPVTLGLSQLSCFVDRRALQPACVH